ncbi:hypothetical protein VKT23_010123 [Stygiomarasmius scandens]|uniref:Transposase n=1 Tax=Marasmiellus scandens TaxID=2682957 RepID=A0ABR1JCQ2_9AGAR
MTKDTLTPQRRESFRHLYRQHVLGLRENFPGFFMPSHHLAFHIYEFMDHFSTVRNWWAFFFERLIGRLQRLPINHIIGQSEKTILYGFNSGAAFRQWLLCPDCPPLLAYCLKLLDKTYSYVKRGYSTGERDDENDEDEHTLQEILHGQKQSEQSKWILASPPATELIRACGSQKSDRIRCYSRIAAPRGFYAIPTGKAVGNSYICFRDGDSWSAGQVQHIFDYSDTNIRVAIKRCVPLDQEPLEDSFSSFWSRGFEAKMVSSAFHNQLEILDKDALLGHVARWELVEGKVVVLSLSRACSFNFTTSRPSTYKLFQD